MYYILRLPAVMARTGLSRSTIYLRISEGRFPVSVPLGGRAIGWIEAEIQEWLEEQIQTSRRSSQMRRVGDMGAHSTSSRTGGE